MEDESPVSEFTIYYDDDPGEVIEKIEKALEKFKLEIEAIEYQDGQIDYRIQYKY